MFISSLIYSHWYHLKDHTKQQDFNITGGTPGREGKKILVYIVGSVWDESHFVF